MQFLFRTHDNYLKRLENLSKNMYFLAFTFSIKLFELSNKAIFFVINQMKTYNFC